MKRLVLAFAAVMMMSGAAMAQGPQGGPQMKDGPRPSKEQMAKMRTDKMVKDYGLNEKQAKKVAKLNEKYAESLPPMGGGKCDKCKKHGQKHPQMKDGQMPEGCDKAPQMKDGQVPPQKPQGCDKAPKDGQAPKDCCKQGGHGHHGGPAPQMDEKKMEKMAKDRQAYDKKLQKIMTPEQYAKYKADNKARGGRHGKPGEKPAPRKTNAVLD